MPAKLSVVLALTLAGVGLVTVTTNAQKAAQHRSAGSVPTPVPTFSKDVAPVLFKHCTGCHRPGEIAPMSLLTYDNARPYARSIATAISNRTMPPWHADAPAGSFENERILSDGERQTLIDWARGGAPNGDAKDLPTAPVYAEGWVLGQPDVILEMAEDYQIPATGTIAYEFFYIPTNFKETKWVQSIEIRPGNRRAVHHVLARHLAKPDLSDPPLVRGNQQHSVLPVKARGEHPQRTDLVDMPKRLVATYAPGTNPQAAPAGTAFRLEPGGMFELGMHYTATGKPEADRTKIGLIFARTAPPREVRATHFFNAALKLPAGAANTEVATDLEFLRDATVWGLFPHTHLRGKTWDYKLVLPSGEIRPILSVPRYDFNWQTYYMFKEPLQIPAGARIVSTASYDNSAANKANPDPTKDVTWGDQTWEEMQYTGILLGAAVPSGGDAK